MSELAIIEIKPDQAPALYVAGGLNNYLAQIRELAKEVPDVTTKKGRDRIGSLARMVGSSKTAIEKPGREYLKRLKEAVKPAEEELRIFTRECDAIRDAILKPRDEWEAEQEAEARADREKAAAVEAERLKAKQAEEARLAEEKRKAEEDARRAADIEHRRTINRRVIADLIAIGIPEEFAQKALLAIAGGKVPDAHIKY